MRKFTKYPSNYVNASTSNERLWGLGDEDENDITWEVFDNTNSVELQNAIDDIGFAIYSDGNFWWVEDWGNTIPNDIFDILNEEMFRLYPERIFTEM